MTYLLLFSYIIIYCSLLRRMKTKPINYFVFFIPIGILLILILGLQDNVGTDYYSYLSLADGVKNIGFIERKSEYLFVILVRFVQSLDNPQMLFILVASIQTFFLMLITYEIKKMKYRLDYFFFLYFFLSLVFFNQFNGIRQYTAVYMVVYALIKIIDSKFIFAFVIIILASLFHSSALFFLLFIIIRKFMVNKISNKIMVFILILIFIFTFMDIDQIYLKILRYIPHYSGYVEASYTQRLSIEGIVTKIPKLMIVIFSILMIDNNVHDYRKRMLINYSYLACAIMILSFSSSVIWRFYQYFDIFLIFPVLILFEDNRKKLYSVLISVMLIIMIVIKVLIIPHGEYLYNSIIF